MRSTRGWLLAVVSMAAMLWLASCSGDAESGAAAKGQAPGFSLTNLEGETVDFERFKGKVVLVDFWATWCKPCRMSIPHLKQLHETYSDDGLEIVGISLDRAGVQTVKNYVRDMNVPYTVVIGNREVAQSWNTGPGIPVAFLVDRSGEIVNKFVGYQDISVLQKEIVQYL